MYKFDCFLNWNKEFDHSNTLIEPPVWSSKSDSLNRNEFQMSMRWEINAIKYLNDPESQVEAITDIFAS